MLSPQIVGIWRQYKQDAGSIAAWLASTARFHGFYRQNTGSEFKTSTSRTKRKAEPTRNDSSGTPLESPNNKLVVALRELPRLAEYIATVKEPGKFVPIAFVAAIDRLISVRASFDKLVEPEFNDLQQDLFVIILKAVKHTLRAHLSNTPNPKSLSAVLPQGNSLQDQSLHLRACEALLRTVYPPPSSADAVLQRPTQRTEDTIEYVLEIPTSREAAVFAYFALLEDLRRIRSRVGWIWTNQKAGNADHAAAAIATNTAVSLARGLAEDANPLLDAYPGGVAGLVNHVFWRIAESTDYSLDKCLRPGYPPDHAWTYELSNDMCYLAFDFMHQLIPRFEQNALTASFTDCEGCENLADDWDAKSTVDKVIADKTLLDQMFTELTTLINGVDSAYPVEDEFIRGLREVKDTNEVTLSLVFAAQIFLDIHHIIGGDMDGIFNHWADEVDEMIYTVIRQVQFLSDSSETEPVDQDLKILLNNVQWMAHDPVYQFRAKEFAKKEFSPVPGQTNRIMRLSPVISGMYLHTIRSAQHELGLATAARTGSIRYAAHLYNAVLTAGLVGNQWEDMSTAMNILGEDSLWGEGQARPSTAESCLKALLGISNHTDDSSSFNKRLLMKRRSKTEDSREYLRGEDLEWAPERIGQMLAFSRHLHEDSPNGRTDFSLKLAIFELSHEKKEKHLEVSDLMIDVAPVDYDDLIAGLAIGLCSETLEIAFPWFLFHRWTWSLLREIRNECGPILKKIQGSDVTQQATDVSTVAALIIKQWANGVDGGPDSRCLESAAEVMKAALPSANNGGNICIKSLREKLLVNVGFLMDSQRGRA